MGSRGPIAKQFVRTKLEYAKPPQARARMWRRALFGSYATTWDAYLQLRAKAVRNGGAVRLNRPQLTKLVRCASTYTWYRLYDLRDLGLIRIEKWGPVTTIYVLELPKKLPSKSILPQRSDASPSDVRAAWAKRGVEYMGETPLWLNGKDHTLAARLLEEYTLASLSTLIWNYFEDVAKGVYKRPSFGHFYSSVGELLAKRGPLRSDKKFVRSAEVQAEIDRDDAEYEAQSAAIRKTMFGKGK